jgi:hypothetical protein
MTSSSEIMVPLYETAGVTFQKFIISKQLTVMYEKGQSHSNHLMLQ